MIGLIAVVAAAAVVCAAPAQGPKSAAGPVGFPSRDHNLDVLPGFRTPPPGYGVVPFYWWLGDPLTKERLLWQLDTLAASGGVTGLQVNYAHSDRGGNSYGLTYPSKPALFSTEWWELFTWWAGECKKRGISVSLSDYTLGIVGQGYWMDEILAAEPTMRGSVLEHSERRVAGGETAEIDAPPGTLSVTVYALRDRKIDAAPVVHLPVTSPAVRWHAPAGEWLVVSVRARVVDASVDPLNPKTGPMIIERFFQRFEDYMPGEGGKTLNFFFSDELTFGVGGKLWTARFADEFRKRKGYDIVPALAELFVDAGPRTPKVRLDYADVMVALSEEAYFRPVFEWHSRRGMVYGCDHGGRGTDVTEFGDYFRTQRWMTGPGCDQPALSTDVIKNKVAASIAHLYERPRVWLEGFHSSGWGTSTADLTRATFENFAMGHNLLSLHGLYYSTHGGWWEWAPPCNGFRMPYWPHMKEWLAFVKRLSYVMSQGVHRCDVAILYPVTPMQAGMDGQKAVNAAFGAGRTLYDAGIDFDFIDDDSVARARAADGALTVAGEQYRVLVLPAMRAIKRATLEKAVAFRRAGGVVVLLDALPEATDSAGRDDQSLASTLRALLADGLTGKGLALMPDAPAGARTYAGGFAGRWAWSKEPAARVWFKAVWTGEAGRYAARAFCDNDGALFVNGKPVAQGFDYATGWSGEIDLRPGDVITLDAVDHDHGDHSASVFLAIARDGRTVLTTTDLGCTVKQPGANWRTGTDQSGLAKPDTDNVHELHKGGGGSAADRLVGVVNAYIARDFVPDAPCHVQHRTIGRRDVFLLTQAAGKRCTFRAQGKAEVWDPWTGATRPLAVEKVADGSTTLRVPDDGQLGHLVVFTPGKPVIAAKPAAPSAPEIVALDGPWEFELAPTMDNRWGDFRQPPSKTVIGAEAGRFSYADGGSGPHPPANAAAWRTVTCGFGPRFWKLGPLPAGADIAALEAALASRTRIDPSEPVTVAGRDFRWHPYAFSWRCGHEGDPGHEGYHGLKEQVTDDFLALGRRRDLMTDTVYEAEGPDAGVYLLWTTVSADRPERVRVEAGERKPGAIHVGGTARRPGDEVDLQAGATPVLLRYDGPGRAHVVLRRADSGAPSARYPLSMRWYLDTAVLPFDPVPAVGSVGWFRFTAPPGLKAMRFAVHGRLQAWIGGKPARVTAGGSGIEGSTTVTVVAAAPSPQPAEVLLRIEQRPGFRDGAAIPEPIALDCGPGELAPGDWSKVGVLEHYSGGAWFRRRVTLSAAQARGPVVLDLGQVISSAEVRINGKRAGVLLASPWRIDVTKQVKPGSNRIEVLVYNTLANHYGTIPTRYRGSTVSGLLGPVRLELEGTSR